MDSPFFPFRLLSCILTCSENATFSSVLLTSCLKCRKVQVRQKEYFSQKKAHSLDFPKTEKKGTLNNFKWCAQFYDSLHLNMLHFAELITVRGNNNEVWDEQFPPYTSNRKSRTNIGIWGNQENGDAWRMGLHPISSTNMRLVDGSWRLMFRRVMSNNFIRDVVEDETIIRHSKLISLLLNMSQIPSRLSHHICISESVQ